MTDELERPTAGGRQGRRRRIAAGLGAAMLVAAAGGLGFGIGRSLDDESASDTDVIVPGDEPPTTDAPAAEPTSDTAPASEPDPEQTADQGATADSVPAAEQPGTEVAPDEPPTTDAASTDQPADAGVVTAEIVSTGPASSGSPGWTVFSESDMDQLYARTTDDGLLVRVHLGDPAYLGHGGVFGQFGEWQPPGWCFPSGQARVSLGGGTPEIVDVGGSPWYSEPYEGRNVSWLTLGRVDDNPHRVVFVQAVDGSTSVTATFGDGSVDTAEVQDGVAVLVVAGEPLTIAHQDGPYEWIEEIHDFSVTFEGGPAPTTIDWSDLGTWDDPDFARSCTPPPPALPEPGEQPADPDAAEAEILAVIDQLYDPTDGGADVADLVDDPTGVAEAQSEVAEGSFADAVASVEVVVVELVFTSPEEAWYRYDIETDLTDLRDRFGIAVEVDGVWKLTRDTICQDLSMASGSCGDPQITPIRPGG